MGVAYTSGFPNPLGPSCGLLGTGPHRRRWTIGEQVKFPLYSQLLPIAGWHHWLNGHESEQAPGDGAGQESLACCSPWGHKESDTTEQLNNNPITPSLSHHPQLGPSSCRKTSSGLPPILHYGELYNHLIIYHNVIRTKSMINVMHLNHPETITPLPVCGKIVFHGTSPWCQKDWGPQLYMTDIWENFSPTSSFYV